MSVSGLRVRVKVSVRVRVRVTVAVRDTQGGIAPTKVLRVILAIEGACE